MGIIKKNKIHNPQIITDTAPTTITADDIGRLWVDKTTNTVSIAMHHKTTGAPELRNFLDSTDTIEIGNKYYSSISEEFATIELQVAGDEQYDFGYDFFTDAVFLENTNQAYDDFYSYYYKEVPETTSNGYIRTLSTSNGIKHVRRANGHDTYTYNSAQYNLVNYTKITLAQEIKDIIEIKFYNKDVLENGYKLLDDKKTILIYADPEGFFVGQTVKVKYLQ